MPSTFNPGLDQDDVVLEQAPVAAQVDKEIVDAGDLSTLVAPTLPTTETTTVEEPKDVGVVPPRGMTSTHVAVDEKPYVDKAVGGDDGEEEEESESLTVRDVEMYRSDNVFASQPCKGPVPDPTKKHDIASALPLPHRSRDDLDRIVEEMRNSASGNNSDLERWSDAFKRALDYYVSGKSFDETLARPGSQWHQFAESDKGIPLKALAVSPNTSKLRGSNVTGDHALSVLNRKLKLGSNIALPLWHSGFWVHMKAPTSSQIIAIDRMISDDKITLGRQTNGLVFSNVSVYLRRAIVDLILSCIYDASIENFSRETLLDSIRVSDYNTLVLGLGCSMNPNGYNLAQPCTDNPGSCTHVTNELVSLPKLSWVDRSALTDYQRGLMADRGTKKKTLDQIAQYQSEGVWNVESRIQLNEEVIMVNKVPTLREDIQSGIKWVEGVVKSVQDVYSTTVLADEDTLNARIAEQAQASTLRQYDGWIDRYEIMDGDGEPITINDRDTIARTCETVTSDPAVITKAFSGIGKYIDSSTICVVGIPNYPCPKCQTPLADPETNPKIIPLAVDELFFTLMRQTVNQVIGKHYTF